MGFLLRLICGSGAIAASVLTPGSLATATCPRPFPDTDLDGDVDQVDFGAFQRCVTVPPTTIDPACACLDRNADNVIDLYDFSAFLTCQSGPGVPADLGCERWPSGLASDDFNSFNLDPSIWSVADPSTDAQISIVGTNTGNAQLQIIVPARTSHAPLPTGMTAPYIAQQINNTDFETEVKFTSLPTARYQLQGIFIEQTVGTYMVFELYRDLDGMRCYAAAYGGGNILQSQNVNVAEGAPMYLRVTRQADLWTARHSLDGTNWTVIAQMNHFITANRVGLLVGNEVDSASPAFTGTIDYFYNTQAPIVAEDAGTAEDTFAPNLFAIETIPDDDAVMVRWSTDEPASSHVEYGLTTDYELGTVSNAALATNHFEQITGLLLGATYHVRVRSHDAAGNSATSHDLAVTVLPDSTRPVLSFWYGRSQTFGQIGTLQPAVDILGNAYDADGISWLGYSLNKGPLTILSMGPNTKRLLQQGDFNADLPLTSLQTGTNTLMVRAVDATGKVTIRPVTVEKVTGNVWPLPYSIDWSQVTRINDVAQVVDGQWMLEPNSVRPTVTGYDRLVGMGDLTWQDYQVTVPITVHAVDTNGYGPPSNGPGVGVLCRWVGHSDDGAQPQQGIYPLGAIGLYRWTNNSGNFFNIFGNNGRLLATAPTSDVLQLNVPYYFKFRVQTGTSHVTYRFKTWPTSQAEPAEWKLVGTQSLATDPGHGSVLLLAHHVDASFGNVTIVPGPFP